MDSLSQVKSSWGDVSGEADVATRVAQLDAALFGPAGMLGEAQAAAPAGAGAEAATAEKKKQKADKKKAAAPVEASDDEDSPEEDFADFDDGDLGSEDVLDWGLDADEDGSLSDEEEYEDDEEGGDSALHDRKKDALDDGDDFGEVIEAHKKEMSKKRKREEQWMDSRSRTHNTNFSSRRAPAPHAYNKKPRF
ncbi:hypothetical protein STCU_11690 [Strigomonas culicis]|nr:hypothetical protein STCU_11690 [Strigomonas culicis]|eukprot:EPY15899.1 hypothetical protein STCU_11690 [Strigomonas culicis]